MERFKQPSKEKVRRWREQHLRREAREISPLRKRNGRPKQHGPQHIRRMPATAADTGEVNMVTTDEMVEAIVNVNVGVTSETYRNSFRNALRELVKLAKAEQLLQMKRDVARAVGIEHRGDR